MSSNGRKSPLGNFGTLLRISEEEPDSTEREVSKKATKKLKKKRRHSVPSMKPLTPGLQKSPTQNSIKITDENKDKEKDGQEENGVWFWVNKNGFPIDDKTWDRMWEHVAKIHPGGYNMVCNVRNSKDHPQIPIPQAPTSFPVNMSVADRLEKIQNYMRELQYNHTGTQFFEIKKNRPLSGLMESAREMIRESLPIKCLEAVILGIFLTNGMIGVERYPISFKSTFGTHVHRHVVLGIYYAGLYGAIGMSRREELMYKPLKYKALSDLILDFESNYIKFHHRLNKIKVGLPVPHDPHSFEPIPWKVVNINVSKTKTKDMIKTLDTHAREIRSKASSWGMSTGVSKKINPVVIDTVKDIYGGNNKLRSSSKSPHSSGSVKNRSSTSSMGNFGNGSSSNYEGNSYLLSRGNSSLGTLKQGSSSEYQTSGEGSNISIHTSCGNSDAKSDSTSLSNHLDSTKSTSEYLLRI